MSDLADLPAFDVRPARTSDVPTIARIVAGFADNRRLLHKETVTYYENVQEFRVAVDRSDQVIGCGALHVLWEDLAEVRTLAVDPAGTAGASVTRCWRNCSSRANGSGCPGCSA